MIVLFLFVSRKSKDRLLRSLKDKTNFSLSASVLRKVLCAQIAYKDK